MLSLPTERSSFAFLQLLDMSPSEAHSVHISPAMTRQLAAVDHENKLMADLPYKS